MSDEQFQPPMATNRDSFLQNLINIVQTTGIEFGITLNVGGVLVSGTLVKGQTYFQAFGEKFAEGNPNWEQDVKDSIASAFAGFGKLFELDDKEKTNVPWGFIHLRDAKVFHPSGAPIPTNQGVWWRGKVSSVDGFCLGIMTAE